MASRKPYNENGYVNLGTYNFEIVKDYAYLGAILTNENELRPDIEKGITNTNIEYYAFLSLVKGQSVLKAIKMKISMTLIQPLATYEAESWSLNKDIVKRLAIFERKS